MVQRTELPWLEKPIRKFFMSSEGPMFAVSSDKEFYIISTKGGHTVFSTTFSETIIDFCITDWNLFSTVSNKTLPFMFLTRNAVIAIDFTTLPQKETPFPSLPVIFTHRLEEKHGFRCISFSLPSNLLALGGETLSVFTCNSALSPVDIPRYATLQGARIESCCFDSSGSVLVALHSDPIYLFSAFKFASHILEQPEPEGADDAHARQKDFPALVITHEIVAWTLYALEAPAVLARWTLLEKVPILAVALANGTALFLTTRQPRTLHTARRPDKFSNLFEKVFFHELARLHSGSGEHTWCLGETLNEASFVRSFRQGMYPYCPHQTLFVAKLLQTRESVQVTGYFLEFAQHPSRQRCPYLNVGTGLVGGTGADQEVEIGPFLQPPLEVVNVLEQSLLLPFVFQERPVAVISSPVYFPTSERFEEAREVILASSFSLVAASVAFNKITNVSSSVVRNTFFYGLPKGAQRSLTIASDSEVFAFINAAPVVPTLIIGEFEERNGFFTLTPIYMHGLRELARTSVAAADCEILAFTHNVLAFRVKCRLFRLFFNCSFSESSVVELELPVRPVYIQKGFVLLEDGRYVLAARPDVVPKRVFAREKDVRAVRVVFEPERGFGDEVTVLGVTSDGFFVKVIVADPGSAEGAYATRPRFVPSSVLSSSLKDFSVEYSCRLTRNVFFVCLSAGQHVLGFCVKLTPLMSNAVLPSAARVVRSWPIELPVGVKTDSFQFISRRFLCATCVIRDRFRDKKRLLKFIDVSFEHPTVRALCRRVGGMAERRIAHVETLREAEALLQFTTPTQDRPSAHFISMNAHQCAFLAIDTAPFMALAYRSDAQRLKAFLLEFRKSVLSVLRRVWADEFSVVIGRLVSEPLGEIFPKSCTETEMFEPEELFRGAASVANEFLKSSSAAARPQSSMFSFRLGAAAAAPVAREAVAKEEVTEAKAMIAFALCVFEKAVVRFATHFPEVLPSMYLASCFPLKSTTADANRLRVAVMAMVSMFSDAMPAAPAIAIALSEPREIQDLWALLRPSLTRISAAIFGAAEEPSSGAGVSASVSFPALPLCVVNAFKLLTFLPPVFLSPLLAAVSTFRFLATHDPMHSTLPLLATARRAQLASMFMKLNNKTVAAFLRRDFSDPRNQNAAEKNAFVLLSRQRVEAAAGYLLLAGDVEKALTFLVRQGGPEYYQLAVALVRVQAHRARMPSTGPHASGAKEYYKTLDGLLKTQFSADAILALVISRFHLDGLCPRLLLALSRVPDMQKTLKRINLDAPGLASCEFSAALVACARLRCALIDPMFDSPVGLEDVQTRLAAVHRAALDELARPPKSEQAPPPAPAPPAFGGFNLMKSFAVAQPAQPFPRAGALSFAADPLAGGFDDPTPAPAAPVAASAPALLRGDVLPAPAELRGILEVISSWCLVADEPPPPRLDDLREWKKHELKKQTNDSLHFPHARSFYATLTGIRVDAPFSERASQFLRSLNFLPPPTFPVVNLVLNALGRLFGVEIADMPEPDELPRDVDDFYASCAASPLSPQALSCFSSFLKYTVYSLLYGVARFRERHQSTERDLLRLKLFTFNELLRKLACSYLLCSSSFADITSGAPEPEHILRDLGRILVTLSVAARRLPSCHARALPLPGAHELVDAGFVAPPRGAADSACSTKLFEHAAPRLEQMLRAMDEADRRVLYRTLQTIAAHIYAFSNTASFVTLRDFPLGELPAGVSAFACARRVAVKEGALLFRGALLAVCDGALLELAADQLRAALADHHRGLETLLARNRETLSVIAASPAFKLEKQPHAGTAPQLHEVLRRDFAAFTAVCVHPVYPVLYAAGTARGHVYIFQAGVERPLAATEVSHRPVASMDFSEDGSCLLCATARGKVFGLQLGEFTISPARAQCDLLQTTRFQAPNGGGSGAVRSLMAGATLFLVSSAAKKGNNFTVGNTLVPMSTGSGAEVAVSKRACPAPLTAVAALRSGHVVVGDARGTLTVLNSHFEHKLVADTDIGRVTALVPMEDFFSLTRRSIPSFGAAQGDGVALQLADPFVAALGEAGIAFLNLRTWRVADQRLLDDPFEFGAPVSPLEFAAVSARGAVAVFSYPRVARAAF
eukprot:gnl/Chilomastix_cuspidata/1900.p1 GENE.gnl/Chilomastix_cuspidata/1900~~gnl/Chilomastix_cuspidata/1900.p1  ORF type:complete len:2109 (-),score=770.53 gnl/Chilomastix_cuspidata/1900:13-6300(-)